eukprot:14812933-Alexandrium_andersonii.AAC.1
MRLLKEDGAPCAQLLSDSSQLGLRLGRVRLSQPPHVPRTERAKGGPVCGRRHPRQHVPKCPPVREVTPGGACRPGGRTASAGPESGDRAHPKPFVPG